MQVPVITTQVIQGKVKTVKSIRVVFAFCCLSIKEGILSFITRNSDFLFADGAVEGILAVFRTTACRNRSSARVYAQPVVEAIG